MPFPNEHAARQLEPGQFKTFRRSSLGFPKGIQAIIGIKENGKTAIQSLRFDKKVWSSDKAKKWLKAHNFKTEVEAAAQKAMDWGGVL